MKHESYVVAVQPQSNGANPRVYPRQHAGWLDILAAGVDGHEVHLVLGKNKNPGIEKGNAIYLFAGGMIRCRIACAGVTLGVFGDAIVLTREDIVRAARVTIPRDVLLTRWEETYNRPPPIPIAFPGARLLWWHPGDEQPFPDWAGAGMPPDVAEAARGLVARFGRPAEKAPEKPAERPVVGIVSGETKTSLVPTVVARSAEPAAAPACAVAAPEPAPEPKAKRAKPGKAKPEAAEAPKQAPAAPEPSGQRSLF